MGEIVRFKPPSKMPARHRRANTPPKRRSFRAGAALRTGLVAIAAVLMLFYWAPPQEIAAIAGESGLTSVSFAMCGRPPHFSCVIDGDTFYLENQSIRIADIDAPETHPSRCEHEADLGKRATSRLQQLLNAGPFELESIDRDKDQYGRKLRNIVRNGRSLGGVLVSEGLARQWTGRRLPWCG